MFGWPNGGRSEIRVHHNSKLASRRRQHRDDAIIMDRSFYFRFGRLALGLLLHEPEDLLGLREVDVRPRKADQIRQPPTL
jgi:hypothetical protein